MTINPKTLPARADELSLEEHAFAVAYATTGNAVQSLRSVFGNASGRSLSALLAESSRLSRKPAIAARVAELRAIANDTLKAGVSDMALRCFEVGTASLSDLQEVMTYACRVCYSADGRTPAWVDAAELAAAIDAHLKSLNTPLPRPVPSAAGGFKHDPFAPPSPSCRACMGHGRVVTRIKPTSEWSAGARALYAGVQTDADGNVTKILIEDRTKYLHMLAQLSGSYAPVKSISATYEIPAASREAQGARLLTPEQLIATLWKGPQS